jgi:hypothetical protein
LSPNYLSKLRPKDSLETSSELREIGAKKTNDRKSVPKWVENDLKATMKMSLVFACQQCYTDFVKFFGKVGKNGLEKSAIRKYLQIAKVLKILAKVSKNV